MRVRRSTVTVVAMVAIGMTIRSPRAGRRIRGSRLCMLVYTLMAVILRLLIMLRRAVMVTNDGSMRIDVSPHVPALVHTVFDTFFGFWIFFILGEFIVIVDPHMLRIVGTRGLLRPSMTTNHNINDQRSITMEELYH